MSSWSILAAATTRSAPETALSPEQLAVSRKSGRRGIAIDEVDYVLYTSPSITSAGTRGSWKADGCRHFPTQSTCSRGDEWHFWQQEYQSDEFTDDPYYEDSILPVIEAGAAELVDGTHVIDDWVRLVPSPGHTPGHVSIHIGVSYPMR